MSLFLGKIHYWLYKKILWAEKTQEEIIQWAEKKSLPVGKWVQQGIERYGSAMEEKPLEEMIDTSNIHGWLQERIKSVELRQADLITTILKEKGEFKEELIEIFKKQGKAAAQEYPEHPNTPEEMLNAVNDFMLEGMPCDRVNKVLANSNDEMTWEVATCLHVPYWNQVNGDVNNFYDFRDAWIDSFMETLNAGFRYNRRADGEYQIVRSQRGELL